MKVLVILAKQHNLPIKYGSAFVGFLSLPSKCFETSPPKSAVIRSRMASLSSISLSCFPFGDALQLESDILDLFAYRNLPTVIATESKVFGASR